MAWSVTRFWLRTREVHKSTGVVAVACALAGVVLGLASVLPRVQAAEPANPSSIAIPPERPWRVVILNDGDPSFPGFIAIDRAIRAALAAPGKHRVETFSEGLDMFRFQAAQVEDEIVALLAKKHGAQHVDAVIAIGPTALEFAEARRKQLWPDARIFFQGVPAEWLPGRQLSPTTMGFLFQQNVADTVELALQIRPETRRLVVISGSGDHDQIMAGAARTQLEPYAKRVPIEYWIGAPFDEFLRRVAQLDSRDTVLYLTIGRDADGRTFIPRDALTQLSRASGAPIFGVYETYIGYGVVGGAVYAIGTRAKILGDLIHELLLTPGIARPLIIPSTASCAVDANELERFDINTRRLPPNCDVRFARPTLWSEYRWYVVGALVVLLAQTSLIVGLVLQRRGRRKAEDEARHGRAELAQASRLALAGELTASIAHEINQPLGAILANAGAAEALLRRGVTNSDELRAIIADIKRQDLRASEVIGRVRALVTTRHAEREPVDVSTLVRDVLTFLQGDAERRGVVVDAVLASDLPHLMADRVQLQQAVVNLCVNAMDAMTDTEPANRRLGVRTALGADGAVEIMVSDTGPGIPQEQLPRLFDSFFTTKPHGMGLGLSISRSVVETHGGTLSAQNREEGGALFRINLPIFDEEATSHAEEHGETSALGEASATTTARDSR